MKKAIAMGLIGITLMSSLTGCSKRVSEYLPDVDYSKYVELCEYKGVNATKIVFDVTEEEILDEVDMYLYDYVTYDPVTDRGVEVGDFAMISYTATIDGEVNADYSGENQDIQVGGGYIYPELEDALVGMKTGESKTVDVILTEEYATEEYIDKTATLDVTLHQITVENMPEYTLEFIQENTEYETLEAFEESLKQNLMETKELDYQYVTIDEILANIVENSKFNGYPESLYKECETLYDEYNEFYASLYGMTVDEYLEMFGIDEETKKQEIEMNVNYELILGALAEKEDINCTEKEINEYIEQNYVDYGYESTDAFLEDYSKSDVGYELIYQKITSFLYENAVFTEISEADYLAEQEAYYEE